MIIMDHRGRHTRQTHTHYGCYRCMMPPRAPAAFCSVCLSINRLYSNIHGTAIFAGTALHLQKPNRCRVSAATRSAEATSIRHTDRLASIRFLEQKSNHSWHRRAKYGTLLYGIAVGKPDGDGVCQEGIEVRRVGFSLGCAP